MDELTIKFRNADEANTVDVSRLGVVAGASPDGLTVKVEPDFTDWADTEAKSIIRATLASVGVWVEFE